MSATHRTGLLLLVGLAFVLGNTFAGAQNEKPVPSTPRKWEFKQCGTLQDAEKLGGDGWELVAVEPAMSYAVREVKQTTNRYFYLKRPKQ